MSGECDKCGEHTLDCECTTQNIPIGFGSNYFQESARILCEESGHACSKWVDWKIYNDLKFLDEKDKGDRAEVYWKRCHSVECQISLKYGSTIPEVKVRCWPNNLRSCELCDYTNEDVEKKLANQLIECELFKYFVTPPLIP